MRLAEKAWWPSMGLLLLGALWLRWPVPSPEWTHIDERVFLLNPLKLWSGDLNPHFFIYPTLHIYLCSALYYLYFLFWHNEPMSAFIAYRFFVDGGDLAILLGSWGTSGPGDLDGDGDVDGSDLAVLLGAWTP